MLSDYFFGRSGGMRRHAFFFDGMTMTPIFIVGRAAGLHKAQTDGIVQRTSGKAIRNFREAG